MKKSEEKIMKKWLKRMERACRLFRTADIAELQIERLGNEWPWKDLSEEDQREYESLNLRADAQLA